MNQPDLFAAPQVSPRPADHFAAETAEYRALLRSGDLGAARALRTRTLAPLARDRGSAHRELGHVRYHGDESREAPSDLSVRDVAAVRFDVEDRLAGLSPGLL